MARLSRAEMETIITRAADQKVWDVWTEDPAVIRKLTKLHGPGEKHGAHARRWKLAKNLVSFRRPRVLTPEQAELMRKRGKELAALRNQAPKS